MKIEELEAATKAQDEQTLAEMKEKLVDAEEKALQRVCAALGVNPDSVKAKEAEPKKDMIRMWVQTPVRVNSDIYHGDITVNIDTARVIQQAIGDRRMRLLRELTGSNYILEELRGGGFAPKCVGQVDGSGERIA